MSEFIDAWLFQHAEKRAGARAVGSTNGWLNYGELASRVRVLAGDLQARGVVRGGCVVNLLPNGIASAAFGLAVQHAGATLVEVNCEAGPAAIGSIVAQTRARHLAVLGRDVRLISGLSGVAHVWLVHDGKPNEKIVQALGTVPFTHVGEKAETDGARTPVAVARDATDTALILFTSGSSGEPRGVMLSYKNVAANARAIVSYLALTPDDCVSSILPLSYSYGRSLLQTHLFCGGAVFFDTRFMYPRVVMEALTQEGCTGFAGVPLTFEVLKQKCDPRDVGTKTLRYVTQAGGAMSAETARWVREAFAPAQMFTMYGQTEATARLSYLPPGAQYSDGAIGCPIPGVELAIVDDNGKPVADGTEGDLVARGDNVMQGYLNAPEETREALKAGWLWTGDLGYRGANGHFFLTGRKKAMLKVSGHRFSPAEVEECLRKHAGVTQAAVVGVSDATTGEAVYAFVVAPDADPQGLRKHCAGQLPMYKVPKHVVVLAELPTNNNGKWAYPRLQEMAAERKRKDETLA